MQEGVEAAAVAQHEVVEESAEPHSQQARKPGGLVQARSPEAAAESAVVLVAVVAVAGGTAAAVASGEEQGRKIWRQPEGCRQPCHSPGLQQPLSLVFHH